MSVPIVARAEISVVFPPIREGDLPTLMGALVEAITLNGFEAGGKDRFEKRIQVLGADPAENPQKGFPAESREVHA